MDGTGSHGKFIKKESFVANPEENKPPEEQYNVEINLQVVNTATKCRSP